MRDKQHKEKRKYVEVSCRVCWHILSAVIFSLVGTIHPMHRGQGLDPCAIVFLDPPADQLLLNFRPSKEACL